MGDFIFRYGSFALGVLNLVLLAAFAFGRDAFITRKEFELHQSETQGRFKTLEDHDKNAPGWDVVNEIKGSVGTMAVAMEGMRARLVGLDEHVGNIDEGVEFIKRHLIEKGA